MQFILENSLTPFIGRNAIANYRKYDLYFKI